MGPCPRVPTGLQTVKAGPEGPHTRDVVLAGGLVAMPSMARGFSRPACVAGPESLGDQAHARERAMLPAARDDVIEHQDPD